MAMLCIVSLQLIAQDCADFGITKMVEGQSSDKFSAITKDNFGNIYYTGYIKGVAKFGSFTINTFGNKNIFIAKIDKNGNFVWVKNVKGFAYNGEGTSINTLSNGEIVLGGNFFGRAQFDNFNLSSTGVGNRTDIFYALLDDNGNFKWVKTIKRATSDAGQYESNLVTIKVDKFDNILLAGNFKGNAKIEGNTFSSNSNSKDFFIASISKDNVVQWVEPFGGNYDDNITDLEIDNNNHIVFSGSYNKSLTIGTTQLFSKSNTNSLNGFIAKITNNREINWVNELGSSRLIVPNSIAINSKNQIYLTGIFNVSTQLGNHTLPFSALGEDFFVSELSSEGNWNWVYNSKKSNAVNETYIANAKYVEVDAEDNVFIAGTFLGFGNFGFQSLRSSLNGEMYDAFISKLNKNNEFIWTIKTNKEPSYSSSISSEGTFLLPSEYGLLHCGNFFGEVIFGGINLTNTSSETKSYLSIISDEIFRFTKPISQDFTINCGDELTLDLSTNWANGVSYSIYPSDGVISDVGSAIKLKPNFSTNYEIVVQNNNGCVLIENIYVEVNNQNPPVIEIQATNNAIVCLGKTILKATDGFESYRWNTGETTQEILADNKGIYWVEVLYEMGCGNRDSIDLKPLFLIESPKGNKLCESLKTLELKLNEGFTNYLWSNGDNSNLVKVNEPGTYWCRASSNDCYYIDSIEVEQHNGVFDFEIKLEYNNNQIEFSANNQAIKSYKWMFTDGTVDTVSNPIKYFDKYGTFQVCLEATDYCGYTNVICKDFNVNRTSNINQINTDAISIYPNPTTDFLYIDTREIVKDFEVFNINGKKINLNISENKILNVVSLQSGNYIIKCKTKNGILFIPFTKN